MDRVLRPHHPCSDVPMSNKLQTESKPRTGNVHHTAAVVEPRLKRIIPVHLGVVAALATGATALYGCTFSFFFLKKQVTFPPMCYSGKKKSVHHL